MSGHRVFRVTVRGRFAGLSDEARRYLVRAQPDHDIFRSAYTAEGTFTYDERVAFFNLRYEIRCDGDADPSVIGLAESKQFLDTMGFGHTGLRAHVVDMAEMWQGPDPVG